jgi:ferritin-like metal-binding protein YciE
MTRTVNEAIDSYITDMLALEQHIHEAFKGQVADLDEDYPDVVRELKGMLGTIDGHIVALQSLADARVAKAQGLADVIKRAGSAILGAGAAAIDFVRMEKLPKDLRDDYTAVSLASIGYVMLHTTALSLGDTEVADVARRHLKNHARHTMLLHNIIPGAVIRFLQADGLPARNDVLGEISRNIGSNIDTAAEMGTTNPADGR